MIVEVDALAADGKAQRLGAILDLQSVQLDIRGIGNGCEASPGFVWDEGQAVVIVVESTGRLGFRKDREMRRRVLYLKPAAQADGDGIRPLGRRFDVFPAQAGIEHRVDDDAIADGNGIAEPGSGGGCGSGVREGERRGREGGAEQADVHLRIPHGMRRGGCARRLLGRPGRGLSQIRCGHRAGQHPRSSASGS